MKDFFFCICESCGNSEWIEYVKNDKDDKEIKGRVNWLTKEGKQRYPWKIDIYLYNSFSKMSMTEKKIQKRWVSYDYEDLICSECENILHPIPFSEIGIKQRISIFNMSSQERINFANSYKMVKILEKNQGEQKDG